jgi:hypothetical protein
MAEARTGRFTPVAVAWRPDYMSCMTRRSAPFVQAYRARLRTRGLRPVQIWLPDTRTRQFVAQVAHDIAAVAQLNADDAAMLDAFERIAAEDLQECD